MTEQCAMGDPSSGMPLGEMPAEDEPGAKMPAAGVHGSAMGHGSQSGSMDGMDMEVMPEHVQEKMRPMMITMPAMHDGMMNEDADVAFACGMIAHQRSIWCRFCSSMVTTRKGSHRDYGKEELYC